MNRILSKYMSEKTEEAITNVPSRETGNTRYTRQDDDKQNTTQYVLDTTMPKQT